MKKLFLIFFIGYINIFAQNDNNFLVPPYLQFATDSSVYILFELKEKNSAKIKYGKTIDDMTEFQNNKEETIHQFLLQNLEPNTKYFYNVFSENANSDILTFHTSTPKDLPISIGIVGDTQDNPEIWGKIANHLWNERPNFVLHAGDIVGVGAKKSDWVDEFLNPGNVLMSRIPVYTVLGNHEGDADWYYKYMQNPFPEYHYTFKYGNAQFFMIDSNRDMREGSEQYVWLEWELAKSDALWKFVVHHHPPYTSDEDDYGNSYREISGTGDKRVLPLIELYDRYNVDFVFYGHIHDYERTHPIKDNKLNLEDGVIYIQTGGGGGGLENYAPTRSWFTAKVRRDHHYCLVNIADNTLQFQALDKDRILFDQFFMSKNKSTEGIGIIPPAPIIEPYNSGILESEEITLKSAFDNTEIYFTTDGSLPDKTSNLYTRPISITEDTEINAIVYQKNSEIKSRISSKKYVKKTPLDPININPTNKGLTYKYYEGYWKKLPDFTKLKEIKSGSVSNFSLDNIANSDDHFAISFEGYIKIEQESIFTFETYSDDGSKLYINDILVVDNDGSHSAKPESGDIALKKGFHRIRVEFFEDYSGEQLKVNFKSKTTQKTNIPDNILFSN